MWCIIGGSTAGSGRLGRCRPQRFFVSFDLRQVILNIISRGTVILIKSPFLSNKRAESSQKGTNELTLAPAAFRIVAEHNLARKRNVVLRAKTSSVMGQN